MRKLAAGVLAGTIAISMPSTAWAVTVPKLPGPSQPSVVPLAPKPKGGYWQLEAKPGETVHLSAEVRNVGPHTATFQVLPVSAGTSSGTGVGYPVDGPTASWLRVVGQDTVTLRPGAGVVVHAILTVPRQARTRQYVGGLEALGAASAGSKGRVSIRQRDASVVAWVATVGHPTRDWVTFGRPVVTAGAGPEVQFRATNSGQRLWAPKVHLSLQAGPCGRPGKVLVSVSRKWSVTVPGTSWAYPLPLSAALGPGRYCGVEQAGSQPPAREVVVVTPAQHHHEVSSPGAAHVRTVKVSSFPVAIVIAIGGLIVLLLGAVLVLLLRRPRR